MLSSVRHSEGAEEAVSARHHMSLWSHHRAIWLQTLCHIQTQQACLHMGGVFPIAGIIQHVSSSYCLSPKLGVFFKSQHFSGKHPSRLLQEKCLLWKVFIFIILLQEGGTLKVTVYLSHRLNSQLTHSH